MMKRGSADLRRLSHDTESIELGRDNSVCEAAMCVGKAGDELKLRNDAMMVFMLAGARQVPGESQHLRALAL
jgi:hypothetical protein